MKDELGEKIMTEFVALRPATCSYLMDDGNNDKIAKETKKKKKKKRERPKKITYSFIEHNKEKSYLIQLP